MDRMDVHILNEKMQTKTQKEKFCVCELTSFCYNSFCYNSNSKTGKSNRSEGGLLILTPTQALTKDSQIEVLTIRKNVFFKQSFLAIANLE